MHHSCGARSRWRCFLIYAMREEAKVDRFDRIADMAKFRYEEPGSVAAVCSVRRRRGSTAASFHGAAASERIAAKQPQPQQQQQPVRAVRQPEDPAAAAARAAAKKAKDEKKRLAQKAKREEQKILKKTQQDDSKAKEADARKKKKDQEQAAKRGKAICGRLSVALGSIDPKLMHNAMAEATRYEAQFCNAAETPTAAQGLAAVRKLRTDLECVYGTLKATAMAEMAALLDSEDLAAVSSAAWKYDGFVEADKGGEVAAVLTVLQTKIHSSKYELRAVIDGKDFGALTAAIEKYGSYSAQSQKALATELRDARTARSTMLSTCARELGGLAYAASSKGGGGKGGGKGSGRNTVTAKQIEKKLKQWSSMPMEGSIGESIAKLRPLLVVKQKEEQAKAKTAAAQKAKDEAVKAKQERADAVAKEEAEFWAQHENKEIEDHAQQDRIWEETAAAAEAVKAAEDAERREAADLAAALASSKAAEEEEQRKLAPLTQKEIAAEERRKEERKLAKKQRQQDEKAKVAAEKKVKLKLEEADRVAAGYKAAAAAVLPSVLVTSPNYSALREGMPMAIDDIYHRLADKTKSISATKQPKKVVWLDLDTGTSNYLL